ncbi:hypothetical protein TorRG33x02_029390 [Trema orientale]|uniref:Uncharacterized protein n=1 Tax=Trema orientale TaxID=63057 RepID=A0A2P5FTR5_TREOI|nr:hypothetical protein TorRG33x02_029390 [Trema orientale]
MLVGLERRARIRCNTRYIFGLIGDLGFDDQPRHHLKPIFALRWAVFVGVGVVFGYGRQILLSLTSWYL